MPSRPRLAVLLVAMLLVALSTIAFSQNTPTTSSPSGGSTTAAQQPKDPVKDATDKTNLIKNVLAIFGSICVAWLALRKWIKDKFTRLMERRNERAIKNEKLQGHYDEYTIRKATRYYIWPKCSSSVDPAHFDEPHKATLATRESLRDKMDAFLKPNDSERYMLILQFSTAIKNASMNSWACARISRTS